MNNQDWEPNDPNVDDYYTEEINTNTMQVVVQQQPQPQQMNIVVKQKNVYDQEMGQMAIYKQENELMKKKEIQKMQEEQISLIRKENELQAQLYANQEPKQPYFTAKGAARCVGYLVLTGIMIAALTGFVFDFIKKYNQEVKKETNKILECKRAYRANRCETPVPQVKDFCASKKECATNDANSQIKSYNILSRIVMEMIADISSGFTWQSIIVVVAIACLCLCASGVLQARRGGDGKIEVQMGKKEDGGAKEKLLAIELENEKANKKIKKKAKSTPAGGGKQMQLMMDMMMKQQNEQQANAQKQNELMMNQMTQLQGRQSNQFALQQPDSTPQYPQNLSIQQ